MKNLSDDLKIKVLPWLVTIAMFMQMLDGSVLNTALPAIAKSFGENPLQMQAVVIAYMLSVAIFLPISGWLADRFGVRKIFTIAVAGFTIGSLLCALSSSLTQLTLARIVQGMGGALLVPVGRLAVLRVYPRSQFVKVLSFIVLPALIGPLIGPTVGGLLVQYATWHWIFLINIPIGIACIAAIFFFMPIIKAVHVHSFDWIGFFLFDSAVLLLFIFSLLHSRLYVLLIAVILILLYCLHALNKKNALFDLKMFKVRGCSVGTAGNFFARLGGGSMPFLAPLFLQTALGYNPAQSGLMLLPMGVTAIFAKSIVNSAIIKLGYRKFLLINTFLLGSFIIMLSLITPSAPVYAILAVFSLFGMSNSLQFTAINTLSLIDLPDNMISGGNAMMSVVMQISMAMGVALGAFLLAYIGRFQIEAKGAVNILQTFHITYIIIGAVSALSMLVFIFVPKDAGTAIQKSEE
ncbi:MAG: DHA2 family efflux MFS transporter permease subunit [Endomicrobia bacterium]|nr:DHA2 family efflux MFS transporter permease subunit [Endomicrobiia bacterium]